MYDEELIQTFIIVFPVVCIVIIALRLIKPQKNRCNSIFLLVCLFVLGWYLCELIRVMSTTALIFNYSMRLGLVFMELSAITMFLLGVLFYRPSFKPPQILLLFLFVIPFCTILFSFMPNFWHLVYEVDSIPSSLSVFYYSVAPWFWVHTIFCYSIVILTTGIVLYGHFHIPRFYRFSSSLIVFAMLLIPVTHIISILGLWPFQLPPLTLTLCVSVILAHIGLLNSEINIFVRHARGHIFQHLEESILVLGEDDRIVDHNPKASEWFDALGIDLVSCSLQSIMDRLAANGAEIKEGPDDNNDTDITLFGDTFIEVYSLRTYKITDRKKRKIGAIAIFTDVTKNRDLFKRMEEKVGIDPLTGLPNRMAYEGARNRLDTSAFYPLSVIVCDANGLKKVNDTLGHKYGDKMLQIIAESLEAACPKPGFIARIGGDEFIYLLPNTDPGKAQTVIERIRETLTNRAKNTSFDLSIACGAATKFSGEEDLENVISLADARMYENKLQIKEARSNAKMVNDSDIITK